MIKQPMDLSTVKKRLKRGHYSTMKQFARDMRLIWTNAQIYNDPDSEVYKQADQLALLFETMFSNAEQSGSNELNNGGAKKGRKGARGGAKPLMEVVELDQSPGREQRAVAKKQGRKKKGRPRTKSRGGAGPKKERSRVEETQLIEKEFPKQKKLELTRMIQRLPTNDLLHIWSILTKYDDKMKGRSEIEVNVDKLPYAALEELFSYVKKRLGGKNGALGKTIQQQTLKSGQGAPKQLATHNDRMMQREVSYVQMNQFLYF